MLAVTLLARVYNNSQLKLVDKFLRFTLKGLNVETKIVGVTPRRWVQVTISGEDEKVALHYLNDEIGLCPASLEEIKKSSAMRGRIIGMDKNRGKLCLDIGVYLPKIIDVSVPLQHLLAQLLGGRRVALEEVADLFGFCENLPLGIKISNVDIANEHIEAMLSEEQLIQYGHWVKSLLDRLVILGTSLEEIELALKMAKCNRDVINVEPLGLFEYALVCKLGTDAEGLIPKIGRNLRNATFTVFNPKKISEFLNYSAAFIS
jgi:hypothetical protein